MSSPPPPLNFCSLLSESKRIISAHSRHFLALSVLFLLPLTFITTIYPTLTHLLLHSQFPHTQVLLRHSLTTNHHHHSAATLLLPLISSLLILSLSLAAVGSITYSVFHGFYGRPVKLVLAIKSIFRSFLPLFVTVITCLIIQFGVCFAFGFLVFLGVKGVELFGFGVNYSSPYFIGICGVVLLFLVLVLVYLQVNWALACVVVVVESSWGLEPLKRSASLVRGMRRAAVSLLLFFGFFIGILVWNSSMPTEGFDGVDYGWKSWAFVLQTVVTTTLVMLLMLHSFAANTVLYMYCKAMNGELAREIADEFSREYVSLPFDDGKVPHVISVMAA